MLTARLEGLDALDRKWRAEVARLERELEDAGWQAGKVGISAAQDSHPYTDRTEMLTGTAKCLPPYPCEGGGNAAAMFWGMPYASFVKDGTSRSRPYDFTPIAIERASADLEVRVRRCVEDFEARLSR